MFVAAPFRQSDPYPAVDGLHGGPGLEGGQDLQRNDAAVAGRATYVDWRGLPDPLIEEIAVGLPARDLCALSQSARRFRQVLLALVFRRRLATEVGRASTPSTLRAALRDAANPILPPSERVAVLTALAGRIGAMHADAVRSLHRDMLDAITRLPAAARARPLAKLIGALGGDIRIVPFRNLDTEAIVQAAWQLPLPERIGVLAFCIDSFHQHGTAGPDPLHVWIEIARTGTLAERASLLALALRRHPPRTASLDDESLQACLQACASLRGADGHPAAEQGHVLRECANQWQLCWVRGRMSDLRAAEALWVELLQRARALPPDAATGMLSVLAEQTALALPGAIERWRRLWDEGDLVPMTARQRAGWLAAMSRGVCHALNAHPWTLVSLAALQLPEADRYPVFVALANVIRRLPTRELRAECWQALYERVTERLPLPLRAQPLAALAAALRADAALTGHEAQQRWNLMDSAMLPLEPHHRLRVLDEVMVDSPSVSELWDLYCSELDRLDHERLAAALETLAIKLPLLSPASLQLSAWHQIAVSVDGLPAHLQRGPWVILVCGIPRWASQAQADHALSALAGMLDRHPPAVRHRWLLDCAIPGIQGNVCTWLLQQAERLPKPLRPEVVARVLCRMRLTGVEPGTALALYDAVTAAVRRLPYRYRAAALWPLAQLRADVMRRLPWQARLRMRQEFRRLAQGVPRGDLPPREQPPEIHGEVALVKRALRRARERPGNGRGASA